MQAYFWGTRGSLPVAPDGVAIREKIRRALLKANGRRFDNAGAAEQFIDAELEFPVRSTYGGNSSCMEIIGGDHYTCCDMGSGLRCLCQQVMFFPPAYISGNAIRIHGGHPVAVLEEAFHRQQSAPCFPVKWNHLGATIEFVHLDADLWY